MKLASQTLHDEAHISIYGDDGTHWSVNAVVSVRIYASGKKARRAIQAMTKNGWAYRKPSICQVDMLPTKNKLRRRKGPITGALPRVVVFYRP